MYNHNITSAAPCILPFNIVLYSRLELNDSQPGTFWYFLTTGTFSCGRNYDQRTTIRTRSLFHKCVVQAQFTKSKRWQCHVLQGSHMLMHGSQVWCRFLLVKHVKIRERKLSHVANVVKWASGSSKSSGKFPDILKRILQNMEDECK